MSVEQSGAMSGTGTCGEAVPATDASHPEVDVDLVLASIGIAATPTGRNVKGRLDLPKGLKFDAHNP